MTTKEKELTVFELKKDYPEFEMLAGDKIILDKQNTDSPLVVAASIEEGYTVIKRDKLTDKFFFVGGALSRSRDF